MGEKLYVDSAQKTQPGPAARLLRALHASRRNGGQLRRRNDRCWI